MFVKDESCPFYDTDIEEEESMPVYDTDIEDVIEKEEGRVRKGGFGGEEDNIEDVVVVANDLYSSMIQTILSVDFEKDINTKLHELMSFEKSIIIKAFGTGKLEDVNPQGIDDMCLASRRPMRWINELCHKHRINFVSLQETKAKAIDLCSIKECWGNLYFDHIVGPSVGNSGGIACIWDPKMFTKDHVSISDYFVALMGTWIPLLSKLLYISCISSLNCPRRVRSERERFGSVFNQQGANVFNHFITSNGLIDPPLDGYAFTWTHKSASKMSKLDRFLFSEGLLESFPHLSAICLDKHLSDHRPILLRETSFDYGPTPFRFFHSWFTMEGFDSFVESTWNSFNIVEENGLIRLKKKLQLLKIAIKAWMKDARMKSNEKKSIILKKLADLDRLIDQGRNNDEILNSRILLLNDLHDINSKSASELAQKAKIHWSIEGDENSKFFHGVINKKRSQLAIRGILVDGNWISEPTAVKNEFFKHFQKQFLSPPDLSIISSFPLCDCDTDKTPGPDGMVNFLEGCNSLLITALIPRFKKPKSFKRPFDPTALIGSVYKIITKILANRLCLVLPCLISDVQSAFVLSRQILDGPFILNELISWCKHKKFKGMIFKVDFEKAFDSVKWEFLEETLKSFGFGHRWCKWISGCLNNARGSVLVNGNPTSEFQFFKGLKQGDPLCPFLFILIMETLHLSFKRILSAGLYKGISITRKKIGNGENTSFWGDIWLGDIAFKDRFKRLGGIELELLNLLRSEVDALVLPNMDDRWSWSLEGLGSFSVKS
ncbi:RNA-directed DNA polymerase, eukaryota [Tanacetum coccineum]